jgi:DNA invertase Pin-like site-specific DNA recombinase
LSREVEQSLFGATLCFVGKQARLGRDQRHLVYAEHVLRARGIGFEVLTGDGASMDTKFPGGKFVFGIFAALAELERTIAGMAVARGRNGGRPYEMAPTSCAWQ